MSENGSVRVTPMRALIAEEIRALMGRRRIGVSELARRMEVSQPYLSRRLSGDVAIDVDDLARIADLLGVDVLALFPGSSQGRLIATVGTTGGKDRQLNDGKDTPTVRPRPNHPKRTSPKVSTRRPSRITPAHTH